jgi:hypothetical protein
MVFSAIARDGLSINNRVSFGKANGRADPAPDAQVGLLTEGLFYVFKTLCVVSGQDLRRKRWKEIWASVPASSDPAENASPSRFNRQKKRRAGAKETA